MHPAPASSCPEGYTEFVVRSLRTLASLALLLVLTGAPIATAVCAEWCAPTSNAAGEAAYAHGHGVLSFYAGELSARLGPTPVAAVAKGLAALLPVLQEWSVQGAPIAPGIPDGGASDRVPKPPSGRRKR